MNSSIKKDLMFWCGSSIISFVIVYVIWLNNKTWGSGSLIISGANDYTIGIIFIGIGVIIGIFICLIAFFETKHDDNYITGVTQRMGVINSFTSTAALNIYFYFLTDKWYIFYILISISFLILRYFGRKSREKLLSFVGKKGVMKTNLHNHGIAIVDGKEIKVFSKEDIYYGSEVEISELRAKYFYVRKCV